MSWGAYITGEGGLLAQYDKIACGGIFGQNGSTFAQAQDRLFSRISLAALVGQGLSADPWYPALTFLKPENNR